MMWNVDRIEFSPVELDFTSSGGGRRSATAVYAGGERLINAIEFIEFEAGATQIHVCEKCGINDCEWGDYVDIRRLGDTLVWLPAWSAMEFDEQSAVQYRPPSFLSKKRIPLFTARTWELLRIHQGCLPELKAVPSVTSHEAVRWLQWTAPAGILGVFPGDPRLQRNALLAVVEGDLKEEADFVDEVLRHGMAAHTPLRVMLTTESPSAIEFILDAPGVQTWRGVSHCQGDACFVIDADLTLVRDAG